MSGHRSSPSRDSHNSQDRVIEDVPPRVQQQPETIQVVIDPTSLSSPYGSEIKDETVETHGRGGGDDGNGVSGEVIRQFGELAEKSIRRGFVRKVLFLISLQFLLTLGFAIPSSVSSSYRDFQKNNLFIFWIALALYVVAVCSLYCYRAIARRVPVNYILLTAFTVSMAYMLSLITSLVEPIIVVLCFATTFTLLIVLFLFVSCYKADISKKASIFICLSMLTILLIIVSIFYNSYIFEAVIGSLLILMYSFTITVRLQAIQGGHSIAYSIDDYVIAAIDVYLEAVKIFLLLICLTRRR